MADTMRKTFKEKLRPTPDQERQLDVILWRCRTLYNVALEQRKTAWERCHVSVKRYAQELELTAIRAAYPEYAAVHSHVLQDVLARLDKAYQAFFRRVLAGKRVEAVPPAYTSQDCSGCGERVEKSLSVRTHVCTSCGLILDRDENAARNIQWAGQALRGVPAVAGAVNREHAAL
jgi:transposase